MTRRVVSRYRLTIATLRGGTCFCIGALNDAEALGKAVRIVSQLEVADADITLTASATRTKIPMPPELVSQASAA